MLVAVGGKLFAAPIVACCLAKSAASLSVSTAFGTRAIASSETLVALPSGALLATPSPSLASRYRLLAQPAQNYMAESLWREMKQRDCFQYRRLFFGSVASLQEKLKGRLGYKAQQIHHHPE
ncbi:MAG: hypothetical protein AAB217_23785 [Chloroflexota bacterium]